MYSSRVYFLIIVVAAVLHTDWRLAAVVIFGYSSLESLDEWRLKRRRDKLIAEELSWTPDPADPEMEIRGALTRKRLTGADQVIVGRLTEYLWKIR
jgi:hypothetical protein